MGELSICKIEHPVESDFSCGITSIDKMAENSFVLSNLRRCYTYQITGNGVVLGYYMIMLKRFPIETLKPPLDDYSIGRYEDIYAMHIQYIAIKEEYQHKRIGSSVLTYIIETVSAMSLECPFRLLTVDALDSVVNWYKSFEFKELYREKENPETVLMYRDMLSNKELETLDQMTEDV